MNRTAVRERSAEKRVHDYWQHVPLDLAVSAMAILVAAGLVLVGVMP